MADPLLAQAAGDLMRRAGDDLGARRLVLLHLFAGQEDKALRELCRMLPSTHADAALAAESVNLMTIATAIGDGSFLKCNRVTTCILQTLEGHRPAGAESRDPAMAAIQECLSRSNTASRRMASAGSQPALQSGDASNALVSVCKEQAKRWVRWGTEALREGDQAWAQTFWRGAIASQQEREAIKRVIDEICSQCSIVGPERLQVVLQTLAKGATSATTQYLITAGMARLAHEDGRYEECLRLFADGEQALAQKGEPVPNDIETELVRVQALIRQKQITEAAKRLTSMEDWPGQNASRAQVGYLLGLIRIQQGEPDEAAQVLERVIERYPGTPAEPKAKQLLQKLKGS
jgi:tetratricopeptide (TPR) repeat protein